MQNLMHRFLRDEAGFVVSTELILIATIVVIGLITGLTTVRDQVLTELADVADAVSEINQSYSFGGVTAHASSTAGSMYADLSDFCDTQNEGAQGITGTNGTCLQINGVAASNEG